jgi:hypothetical protein
VDKIVLAAILVLSGIAAGQSKSTRKPTPEPETPHLRFVKEYVRELVEDESLVKSGEKEFGEAKTPEEQFSKGIYVSKSAQLALRSQIDMLRSMRLNDPFDTLTSTLIACYQRQIDLHQKLIGISGKFLAGPKPGVDYQALEAKVPEIRAEMDDARKVVFDAASLVFMSLVDMKEDSQGHASHLLITKAESADLQQQLDLILKGVPNEGDHDFYISAAMVLRAGLQKKGYKFADDPWE